MGDLNACLLNHACLDENLVPSELRWFFSKVPEKERKLPDAFKGHFASIIVSEPFRDIIAEHEIGRTQIIELPLYELREMTKMGQTTADYDKKDPGRWFLLNVVEFKNALKPDECGNLVEPISHRPGYYSFDPSNAPLIALDADVAAAGVPVWREKHLRDGVFFSDDIKRAVKAAKLKTPAFSFKPCVLF